MYGQSHFLSLTSEWHAVSSLLAQVHHLVTFTPMSQQQLVMRAVHGIGIWEFQLIQLYSYRLWNDTIIPRIILVPSRLVPKY